jgi:signal recognition particle GTPase
MASHVPAVWDLDDFLEQLENVKRMGPIEDLVKRVPGLEALTGEIDPTEASASIETILKICLAMSPDERKDPAGLVGPGATPTRMRIAEQAGVDPDEVESLVEQFLDMRTRVRAMMQSNGRLPSVEGRPAARRRESTMALAEVPDTDTFEERVDELLRKITATGMSSLTPEERGALEEASKTYRERKGRSSAPAADED